VIILGIEVPLTDHTNDAYASACYCISNILIFGSFSISPRREVETSRTVRDHSSISRTDGPASDSKPTHGERYLVRR